MPDRPSPLVHVRGLHKRYRDAWAVADLDLDVHAGEIVGLLGPNGAGKTTTLEILCALRRPTSGVVLVAGADPTRDPRAVRTHVGTVLQSPALDPVATARQTLIVQARLRGSTAREARAAAEAALDGIGLLDKADERLATLSGGQRRRVDLATASIGSPRLLILDEPTTGLDAVSRRALWTQVRRLAAQGLGVLLSTQDLGEAEQLADRLVVMRAGLVVANATAAELRSAAGERSLVIRLADAQSRGRALQVAATCGVPALGDAGDPRTLRIPLDGAREHLPTDYLAAVAAAALPVTDLRVAEPGLDDAVIGLTA